MGVPVLFGFCDDHLRALMQVFLTPPTKLVSDPLETTTIAVSRLGADFSLLDELSMDALPDRLGSMVPRSV